VAPKEVVLAMRRMFHNVRESRGCGVLEAKQLLRYALEMATVDGNKPPPSTRFTPEIVR